jgi:hypothetical protein
MNRCDATFKKAVVLACCDALEREGFTRFRKEHVDWPLDEGFHCWVGLNTGLYPEVLHINPFVGLHVVPIEKLWTSCKAGKYPGKYDRGHATYARHMGELAADVPAFQFTPSTDVPSEARRLARLYAMVGLEFAKAIANYESILPLLKQRIEVLGAYPERYASCLYLIGRKTEARAFVEQFLPRHRDYFEGFAIPFLQMLENGDGRKKGAKAR